MPRSYRHIFFALVGWLVLSAANQPTKNTQSDASASKTQEAQPAAPSKPPYAPYPNLYAEACYKAQDHEAADLCAQWRAALATEKAAQEARRATSWAIVAAFLSLATVIGLIVTIWQTFGALGEARRGNLIAQRANARSTRQAIHSADDTKEALRIARRNATAANSLAKHSERAARVQLRPYLAISGVEVEEEEFKAKRPVCPVRIAVVNNGQTPATVTRLYIQFLWHAGGLFTTLLQLEKTTRFRVHKGKRDTHMPIWISARGDGLDKPGQLLAFIMIDYSDVFEKKYSEIFCFQGGDGSGTERFSELDFPFHMNLFPLPDYQNLLGLDENFQPKGKPSRKAKSDGKADKKA